MLELKEFNKVNEPNKYYKWNVASMEYRLLILKFFTNG